MVAAMKPSTANRRRVGRLSILVLSSAGLVGLASLSSASLPMQGQGPSAAGTQVIAWNDLGMHCIDPDFSVFAILPPYNTINSHLIVGGKLHKQADVKFTYEAIADPSGSINTTSIGKTNFWDHVKDLFGVALLPDVGLAGNAMPGASNTPQPMRFDAAWNWFQGEGIPFTPIDNSKKKNPYPLLKITARDALNQVIASTITTAPVSQELECSLCHASGANPRAMPYGGWVFDANPIKDNRFNILKRHDDIDLARPSYQAALAKAGYNKNGLFATAKTDGKAVLCSRCHATNALPGTGYPGIPPLTESMHGWHSRVLDETGHELDANPTRTTCYHCHPGFETKCLRGAMGRAIGSDGDFAMQCQGCHGSMAAVGKAQRVGWLDQPSCQNCHTGTATSNSGAIRFTTVFDANGKRRTPASQVFATNKDVPKTGFSLYRYSRGHGGLQCSACHGSPHAIYPSATDNDNLQSRAIQGHEGTINECSACHASLEDNQLLGGPHGSHPASADWARGKHGDIAKHVGRAVCQACHGTDYRGTELSRAHDNRTFTTELGVKTFWRRFQVGCYVCHNGPYDDHRIRNAAPVVADLKLATPSDQPLVTKLSGTDADQDPLTLRIVEQPRHGTVAFTNNTATYRAEAGYLGVDSYTYAASDSKTESNLGTVTITVGKPTCMGEAIAYGFGCPGAGGFQPLLSATCPSPGKTVTVSLDKGRGGAISVPLFGTDRGILMLPTGCVLRVTPLLLVGAPILLSGTKPGEGHFDLPIPIPQNVIGNVTMQAFVIDNQTFTGWSNTNGLELRIR